VRRLPSVFYASAAAAAALFVGVAAFASTGSTDGLDRTVAAWGGGDSAPAPAAVAALILLLASVAPYVLAPIVGVVLWQRRRRLMAVVLSMNFAISIALTIVLKVATDRARPENGNAGLPMPGDEASFPSSSVVSCVAFWGLAATLAVVVGGFRGRTRTLVIVAVTLSLLVGPARLYVGGHWFTDIIGGYLLATTTLCASTGLYLRWPSQTSPPGRLEHQVLRGTGTSGEP
jgi:membrane-associated phospholipid phosphatase